MVFADFIDERGACCFFQLELIIDSETGFASSTNILNLVDQLKGKKMRKKEAEQVLQKFVQNKWLIEVRCPVAPRSARRSDPVTNLPPEPHRSQVSAELGPLTPCISRPHDPPSCGVQEPGRKCRTGTTPVRAPGPQTGGLRALWVRAPLWCCTWARVLVR